MKPLLKMQAVSLCFAEYEKPVVNSINTQLYPGESVVVLGGNGSGKSSLIKLINRTHHGIGHIELNQKNLENWTKKDFAGSVVTLAQDPGQSLFYDLTVLENCILWGSRFQSKFFAFNKVEKLFYSDYLTEYHEKLKERLDTKVKYLSGGEKQALLLAVCLFKPPLLLLLDEHTSALDPHQADHIMKLTHDIVKKRKVATLMTTHNLDHALRFGDRLIAIKEGKIVFEANKEQKEQLSRSDLLEYCY